MQQIYKGLALRVRQGAGQTISTWRTAAEWWENGRQTSVEMSHKNQKVMVTIVVNIGIIISLETVEYGESLQKRT